MCFPLVLSDPNRRALAWSHNVSSGLIGSSFEPDQCLLAGRQKITPLATKRSAGVAPDENLKQAPMPPPSANKACALRFLKQSENKSFGIGSNLFMDVLLYCSLLLKSLFSSRHKTKTQAK